ASTLGLMLSMTPMVGILTALTWLFMAVIFKYSSLSALTALAIAPLYALLHSDIDASLFYAVLCVLSFWRHKENIRRLIKGEESKINLKKKKK
ncbi:MAG: glycerol-3-phosphate acyltransferase, partial [Alphaproteobacteria bacterium]|nr:glycerol-3-phosphate acyltransferase [Alphaproteobacteria bacterium]